MTPHVIMYAAEPMWNRVKQLPCPSKIASFSWKLNGEAILKVSFKNVDQFQKYKSEKIGEFLVEPRRNKTKGTLVHERG